MRGAPQHGLHVCVSPPPGQHRATPMLSSHCRRHPPLKRAAKDHQLHNTTHHRDPFSLYSNPFPSGPISVLIVVY